MRQILFVAVLSIIGFVQAQTLTTVDDAGNTVVEVLTTDLLGGPLTSTIETLAPSTTSPAIAPVQQGQQGPVGQPQATVFTPGGTTPYTYITVIGGITNTVADVFTPTRPITQQPSIGASGTILEYSSWLAEFGPTTSAGASTKVNEAIGQCRSGVVATLALGLAVSMALVLH
ncbi:hypothetical protein DXG01_004539 [Tephrocybe rancida]|nr:hypothetical protein DXG01_004539 [Tephrocybe rancida]